MVLEEEILDCGMAHELAPEERKNLLESDAFLLDQELHGMHPLQLERFRPMSWLVNLITPADRSIAHDVVRSFVFGKALPRS